MSDKVPESSSKVELTLYDAQRLDATDHERHQHRNEGDSHVIEQLANGLDKRPAIGSQHHNAVGRIHEGHPGRKHEWQQER